MSTLLHDIRFAARALSHTPGITAAAIVTLALAIGVNTAMFSVTFGVMGRPLPYAAPSALVVVTAEGTFDGQVRRTNYSAAEFEGWRERVRAFESIAVWGVNGHGLRTAAGLESISGAYISPTFFSTLDEPLALGRWIDSRDQRSPVAVISHRLWTSRFGADDHVLGRSISLDALPYTIIGVTKPDFHFPSTRTDVWTPVGYARDLGMEPWIAHPRGGGFHFVARMRSGVTRAAAQADAEAVARSLVDEFPENSRGRRPLVIGFTDWFAGTAKGPLLMFSGAAFLLLAVAYANVMNLLLARHASRAREIAIRRALGAGTGRLLAASSAESAIVAFAGGLAGMLVAFGGVTLLRWLRPVWLPRLEDVRIDLPVLLFMLGLTAVTGAACAIVPVFQQTHGALMTVLRSASPGQTETPGARWLRSILVVGEVAISIVLLVGALLLGRSLVRLLSVDIGIATDHVIVTRLDLALGRDLPGPRQTGLVERLVERVGALPVVRRAGAGTSLPPDAARRRNTLTQVDSRTGQAHDIEVDALSVTPGYFSTLGVPLVSGRLFTAGDTYDAPRVVIVSVATARRVFGERNPIGRRLALPSDRDPTGREDATVIGVVGNVKYEGLEAAADGGIYRPFAQEPMPSVFLIALTTGDPLAIAHDLRQQIVGVDREIGIQGLEPLDEAVSRGTAPPRFRAVLLVAIAAVALTLACVGLYGMLTHAVSLRVREIGVRMALGATPSNVTAMVLRDGLVLACTGAALGVGGALALARLLSTLLYGVAPTDLLSFAAACVTVLAVALAASYLPARRAARVDPLVSLRAE